MVAVEELLRRSDIAMYEAKKIGGNRIAYYDTEIDARLQERVSLTAQPAARRSPRTSSTSNYQVIVDAATHEPRGRRGADPLDGTRWTEDRAG